jgi:hypothetical protein
MAQLNPDQYKRLTAPVSPEYGKSYGIYYDQTNSQIVVAANDTVIAKIPLTQTSGTALISDGTDVEPTAISGDVALSGAGAATISDLTIASEARGDILRRGASAWERVSAKTSGQILVGDGTDIASVAVSGDVALTSAGVVTIAQNIIRQRSVTISSADITGTSAGQLSHANGYELVPAPGAQEVIEFISAVLIYDFDTAAYTGGGNVTVRYTGGLQQSAVISAANSFTSSADTINTALPNSASTLTTAGKGVGLSLVTASAITQPGTAAGVARVKITYRIHTTGL